MTGEELAHRPVRPDGVARFGYPARLRREGQRLALLVVGHLIVFALALGHDEIVAECVEAGLISPRRAEGVELLIGFALFICWSALTIGIVRLVDRARAEARETGQESRQ